jgi:hypothetical protein
MEYGIEHWWIMNMIHVKKTMMLSVHPERERERARESER